MPHKMSHGYCWLLKSGSLAGKSSHQQSVNEMNPFKVEMEPLFEIWGKLRDRRPGQKFKV